MLTPDMPRARVRYLLERGRAFNSSGQAHKALPFFEQAWELGRSAGETRLEFDALHMIAIGQPDPARKVEWNLRGIAAVRQTPSQQGWLPAFYNNLGEAYAAQEDYENALKAFRDMAALDTDAGKPPELYTQKDIAKMLRKLGRVEEAMALLIALHKELDRKGQPDGWIDEELAECLLVSGRDAEAKPLFVRAYEAQKNDPWVLKNEPSKLNRMKHLAGK
jgi:tetratricopeptide (TPR) repeat protein